MEQTLPRKKVYKIIVIGDSGVGKTCLTYRFCEGKFCQNTEATIAVDFRTRNLDINGELITLQIWDTAGMERFRQSMVKHYYRNVHAILLVYDMTNQKSFDSLKNLIVECNENTYSDALRIMVGNKCDKDTVVVERTVAQKFADANNMPLFETSAKLDSEYDNVEAIFMTLAHKLINHKSMILTPTITLKSISSSDNSPSGGGCWPCS